MKHRPVIIFFLLFRILPALSQVSEMKADWEYQGRGFIEFADSAEARHPVKLFFDNEWVKDIVIQDFGRDKNIIQILERTLTGKKIWFRSDASGNIILTREYSIRSMNQATKAETQYLPRTDYSKPADQEQPGNFILREIGNPAERLKPGNAVVSGYVRIRESGEPLTGVAVYLPEIRRGTVTNEFGFYNLNIPKGDYRIRVTMLGMKEVNYTTRIYGNGKLDIEMSETLIPLKETIITAEKNNLLERFEVGLEKMNMRTVKLMPTSMGETDVLKSMLLLPGVKSVGEGSSGFNVRGGAADQNLILLYGAPVFNTSHFFGFFSAVSSDIIKDVLLYKGGIPAQYGGRISSVIDIIPRDGSKENLRGNAGISPVTSHLLVETPLIKDKMSFIASGRTTYSSWLLGRIPNQALRNSRASFYDLSGRIVYDINNSNMIELSSYSSDDSFRFNADTTYNYNNNILALRYRHTFSPKFLAMLSASSSRYDYSISSQRNPEDAFILDHSINYTGMKADFSLYSLTGHRLNFGAEAIRYRILPGSLSPGNDSSLVTPKTIQRDNAFEAAVFLENKITLTSRLSVNAGLRYSIFAAAGPKTIMKYDPEQSPGQSAVTDTIFAGSNEIYKNYHGPELRVSLNFLLTPVSSLKINYNSTRQYLHLLSNTTSISPTDTWKLSDYHLRPQKGHQFSAGWYQTFPGRGIELSAEAYYKPVRNMIDFRGGANLILNEYIEREIVNVDGRAYGIELLFRKNLGKTSMNVSYTYSRTLLRSRTAFRIDEINSGRWFPASYDKPNDLNVTLSHIATRRLSFSLNYTYNTGRPVTFPVTVYKTAGIWVVDYSDRNQYRLPYYSRLDLSARLNGSLRTGKVVNPYWTFSWYNVLGRDNVYSVFFKTNGTTVTGYRLSVFAVSIPTLTFNFDF